MDKKVLRNLSYGVYLVSSIDDKKVGCIANSVMQITSDPAIIAISINHDNYTNEIIKRVKKFGVSILDEKVDASIIGTFGYKTSKEVDKYEGISTEDLEGVPVLKDCSGSFVCKVIDTVETSTHTIFLGEMINTKEGARKNPMTYRYYHEVLKGKSPSKAPTYIEEKEESNEKKAVWKCEVCGYEVEMDELPEDYICPICGRPASNFKKIYK